MDFSKLTQSELDEFLNQDYSAYGVQRNLNLSKVNQAQLLFNQLQPISGINFPLPVIDLYLSSVYSGPKNLTYTLDQILNLTPQEVQAFDQLFKFNAGLNDIETNRKRILRILRFLGLLNPETFIQAAQNGDLNQVRKLLDDGLDPNVQNEIGETALIVAISRNQSEIVRLLLESGADPNLQDRVKRTPLMIASSRNRPENVKLLLERGANLNVQDLSGETALMQASIEKYPETVRLLLERGADPNLQNNDGKTALMIAFERGSYDIAELLLNYGGNAGDQNGQIALMVASARNRPEIVRSALASGADPKFQYKYSVNPLIEASQNGNLEIVRLLLDAGANPNVKSFEEFTPLITASMWNRLDVVRLLLERGADPNIRDQTGKTALRWALDMGHSNAAQLLRQYTG